MQNPLSELQKLAIDRTIKNLKSNKMDAFYVESKSDLPSLLDKLILDEKSVGFGGSVSLYEAGIIDYIKNRNVDFIDRDKPGLSREEVHECMRQSFFADYYLTSSNAVTENGELFNSDGNGNRVAAMIYGPKNVIVVVGVNKIVKDLEQAKIRLESIAAPANTIRLKKATPCAKTGKCMDCSSDDRICCSFVTLAQQRVANRIKVIIVNENLGY